MHFRILELLVMKFRTLMACRMNTSYGSGPHTVFFYSRLGTEMSGRHQALLENALSTIRTYMTRLLQDNSGINPSL